MWAGVFAIVLIGFNALTTAYQTHFSNLEKIELYKEDYSSYKRTDLNISSIHYNNTSGNLEAYVVNTGSEVNRIYNDKKICLGFYVDSSWIGKDQFDVRILNKSYQPENWDPAETIRVNTSVQLEAGTHSSRIVSCNGKKDSLNFTA